MYLSTSYYGWQPDLPDHRDFLYAVPHGTSLPPKVDLRPSCPAVYDQGQLGSCTANAIGAAFEFDLIKQQTKDFMPSRLFIYFNERVIENSVSTDAGAQIRDGIKSIGHQGVCPEEMWPYIISQFAQKPHLECYKEALKHKAIAYHRVTRSLDLMKGCLAEGYPFVFGFSVYESFESQETAQTGVLNLPKPKEQLLGGHAVLAVGYDDAQKRFIVRNSWGANWGQAGYFTIPYDYLLNENLSDDFWTVRTVKV